MECERYKKHLYWPRSPFLVKTELVSCNISKKQSKLFIYICLIFVRNEKQNVWKSLRDQRRFQSWCYWFRIRQWQRRLYTYLVQKVAKSKNWHGPKVLDGRITNYFYNTKKKYTKFSRSEKKLFNTKSLFAFSNNQEFSLKKKIEVSACIFFSIFKKIW